MKTLFITITISNSRQKSVQNYFTHLTLSSVQSVLKYLSDQDANDITVKLCNTSTGDLFEDFYRDSILDCKKDGCFYSDKGTRLAYRSFIQHGQNKNSFIGCFETRNEAQAVIDKNRSRYENPVGQVLVDVIHDNH